MKPSFLISSLWIVAVSEIIASHVAPLIVEGAQPPGGLSPRFAMLSNEEAWQRLPAAKQGHGAPLPTWARILAGEYPQTTAAMLQLDLAQRSASPVPAELVAAMRWVAADSNRCAYTLAQSAADARRAGVDAAKLASLQSGSFQGWSDSQRDALVFARKMTVDSDSVTDDEFANLVRHFGQKQAASMVLMMAYANFYDRFLLSIGAPLEANGPLPPVELSFPPEAFVVKTTPPPARPAHPELLKPTGKDSVDDDGDWAITTYDSLQTRLEVQRLKPTRLPVLPWSEVAKNLPEGLLKRPSDIVWYRIVFAYAPELAVPFERVMRTAGAEASSKWDRIFGQGLFWVTTRAVKCPYCMGHCEMNWEVAGLSKDEIATRSRLLAGNDWSSFPVREQHAYAFARKLTSEPWAVSDADVAQLKDDFGTDKAMLVLLNASRYHYMTRISNGFQLTLERDNVFYEFYNVASAAAPQAAIESPNVPLTSVEDCWKRLPGTVSGGGQTLPNWVRGIVNHLPRTAAAMLQLDYAHRTQSPIDPVLRAKMRWVIAHANHCAYSEAYAIADLKRAGAPADALKVLTGDPLNWPEADRAPLEFARLLTVAAPTIPDTLFESLRQRYGDKQVAAMVLLAAYGNFQDRIALGLNLPIEVGGPLPPLKIQFAEDAFQIAPVYPPQTQPSKLLAQGQDVVSEDEDWSQISYDELQRRLEKQRDRKPRLPIPNWEDVKRNLPPAMSARPTRIVWNLVCSGYVPELAVPWSIATRTMWSETKPDRVLEESLFWIQTRSIECNYCMGHCEMLLEVAGLDKEQVAERTRRLASSDWSAFPPSEQRAFAYARKLSKAPWTLTADDYARLEADQGPEKAMATFWWLCRGLYMTRVSGGFQLPLERDNVFADPAKAANSSPSINSGKD